MEIIKTHIDGPVILEPKVFGDARGYFLESFSQREFDEKFAIPQYGHPIIFVQDNESMSSYGVMRGLHFQRPPYTQSKIVRCVQGRVLDVAVDIRKGSPTYGQNIAVERRHEPCRHICTALRKLLGDGAAARLYVYYTAKTESAGSRRHLEQRRNIEMRCVRSAAYDKDLYHFDIPSIP